MSSAGAMGDVSSESKTAVRLRRRYERSRQPCRPPISSQTGLSAQICISAPTACADERGEVNALTYLYGYFTRLLAAGRREEGQTMAEYGVILAVITVAIIAVLVFLSDGIRNNLQAVVDALS
jgi:Flp pilus assembly pilin Flp